MAALLRREYGGLLGKHVALAVDFRERAESYRDRQLPGGLFWGRGLVGCWLVGSRSWPPQCF